MSLMDNLKKSIDWYSREKEGDLTQSYDKTPYTNRKIRKPKDNTHKRHQKLRLHNDCGPT